MIKWNDELKNRANKHINSPIVRNNEKKVNGYQIMVLIFFFLIYTLMLQKHVLMQSNPCYNKIPYE